MFRFNSLKLLFIGTFIGSALAISTIATASELSDSEVKALRAEAQQLVANQKKARRGSDKNCSGNFGAPS